jgi:cellulose synthase/poly-beta-1,6-N-acetylglucosamine synthase-like glycosyltransferase
MTVLSVLVPVLNEEKMIRTTLKSILNQDGAELEVLVIDGQSADETAAVVADISARDARVKLLESDQQSIPAGLNVGLRHCTGDFVARVDGHSRLNADYFQHALSWLHREPTLAGVGGHRVGVATTPVGRAIALVQSSKFAIGNSIYHYAQRPQLTDHATFGVYRARAVREVAGWDESLLANEDVDFDHRLIQAGYSLGYQPAMVVHWKVRERIADLFRQYRRYGRGKAAMIRKNGRAAIRLRHLVPPTAVLGGTLLLLGAAIEPWLLLGLLPYLAMVTAVSVLTWRKRPAGEKTSWIAIPAAFVVTHAGWGLGFLEGMLLRRRPACASGSQAVRSSASRADISRNRVRATSTDPT